MKYFVFLLLSLFAIETYSDSAFKIGRLKYEGGGDWYNDPSSEVNLLEFVRANTNIDVDPTYQPVDLNSSDVFDYPFLFVTGHGSIYLTELNKRYLRAYLEAGGFVYIDDDYGMDKYIRSQLDELFPNTTLETIQLTHPIYSSHFTFDRGIPKIHEHDDKAPEMLGLYVDGRLALVYTVESNPSDGWADSSVHDNPEEKRQAALKFGTNVVVFALTN